MDIL
ncbi:hypothetical protein Patl1_20749 [Pistacia atlantica]|jgi:mannosyl-oligosaccharide glucosidase